MDAAADNSGQQQGHQDNAAGALYEGVGARLSEQTGADLQLAGVAAWSLVHGFAILWLNRALPAELGEDPQTAARAVARFLFRAP